VRKYPIFRFSITDNSRNKARKEKKAIINELEVIKKKWDKLPVDSAEDAKLSAKIKELEARLKEKGFEYYGAGEQLIEDDSDSAELETIPSPELGPEELAFQNITFSLLKQCISSLEKTKPELYKIAAFIIDCKAKLRRGKDGGYLFDDCYIARELSIPKHIARRGVEKVENLLRACMAEKAHSEEQDNA